MTDVGLLIFLAAVVSTLIVLVVQHGMVGLMRGLGTGMEKTWTRIAFGPAKPPPALPDPYEGCDPRVRVALAANRPLDEVIVEAELLAYRLHNASVPREEQQRPDPPKGPARPPMSGVEVAAYVPLGQAIPGDLPVNSIVALEVDRFHRDADRIRVFRRDADRIRAHDAVSLPHVTATTPKVTYDLHTPCRECEFETMTMFGGEVAIPIRVRACPVHGGTRW